jgi:hypothetical protein
MKFREPRKLHRKSGVWGTRRLVLGQSPKALTRGYRPGHGRRLNASVPAR